MKGKSRTILLSSIIVMVALVLLLPTMSQAQQVQQQQQAGQQQQMGQQQQGHTVPEPDPTVLLMIGLVGYGLQRRKRGRSSLARTPGLPS